MKGPSSISRYRLLRRIGAGGMGVVYEAEDDRDNKKVALKVLLPHAAEENDGISRFKREFRALARLRHPNIVRVFDAGIEDDTPYIAMEYLSGKDVRTYLRGFPEGPLRDREIVRILRQLFGALAHIHARRIVHRDLKPENILVTADGRVKLMDFGVARLLRMETTSSGLLGTFAYMSPEQVTTGESDGRSDLYAVGVLLFELLTGRYPFPIEPPAAALHHHVNTPPDLVRHINPKADPMLAALTKKLLEKDPMDRPQSAEEAISLLSGGGDLLVDRPADGSRELLGNLFVPRFVARAQDLDTLDGVASDAAAGKGRIALIEGPSGVGKSRLIDELKIRLRRRAHVLSGQCAPEGMQAYGAFQGILDGIAAALHRAPTDVVARVVGRDVALVASVSPRLAGFGGPASTVHLDPTERKIRLHKAMVGVIGRLALTKPVVLILEDLHWADTPTLELVWDTARTLLAPRPDGVDGETVCPAALVITRRIGGEGPDPSDALIRRLDPRSRVSRIVLEPLRPEDVSEMLRTMTGVARPMPSVVEALMEESQGLPLMVQDVIQSWVTDGVLIRKQGHWTYRGIPLDLGEGSRDGSVSSQPPLETPEPTDEPKPRGADEVARKKLQSLDPGALALVEKLALVGRVLPSPLVAAVSGLPEEQLLDAVDDLVRSKILVEEVGDDGVRYRFYHEGFSGAVVRGIEPRRKASLHLGVARSIELTFRKDRDQLAHVLARHFRHAELPERGVRYLRKLAVTAAARGDLDGALRRVEDARAALNLGPPEQARKTRRARLELCRIDLLLDFGRSVEALEAADPNLAEGTRDPRLIAGELLLRRATAQMSLGRLDEALASLGRVQRPMPSRLLGARALGLEGRIRMARGEYTKARAVLEAARAVASETAPLDVVEELDAAIGVAMLHQGDYLAALERLEDTLKKARAGNRSKRIAELVGHIGLVHAARNARTDALACFREAIELAEARGVPADRERWAGAMGVVLSEMSPSEEALEKLKEALELATESGNRQSQATWRAELGIHWFAAGRYERATQELSRALAIARDIGFARYEAWAEIYLGAAILERDYDRVEEARAHIEAGLERAQEIGNDELRIMGLVFLSRVLKAEGESQKAADAIERAEILSLASQNLLIRGRVRAERHGR
ncbi:MAG: protein kinase [Myxococcota bacterium]